jgi:Protein of unknown function (DUF3052)
MGRKCAAFVSFDEQRAAGEARLESDYLSFRGTFRLKIPFGEIRELTTSGDTLRVGFGDGQTATFELGAREAALWLDKVRNPRSLLDKLGVKATDAVAVIDFDDDGFLASLRARLATDPATSAAGPCDAIFYGADSHAALRRLRALRDALAPAGAVWIVSRKGKAATIKDTDVMAAAREAGLVDTKVAAFSATHTALKLVIPRAARK